MEKHIKYQEIKITKIFSFLIERGEMIILIAVGCGLILSICYTLAARANGITILQIGENTKNLKHLTDTSTGRATVIGSLEAKIATLEKKAIIDKTEKYLNDIATKIDGYYSTWNSSKGKTHYSIGIRAAFFASERLFEKKVVKYYAPTSRECALKLLATAKNESNFTYNLICQNYAKDGNGLYETVYGYKIKKKEGFEFALVKTSKDYGWLQCNECNVNLTLKRLKELGLWNEKENRWLLDPEVNAMMRILIDNERIRQGWNTPTSTNYDKNFYSMLLKVDPSK